MTGDDREAFLSGGGEMGALIRAHDWHAAGIGRPATWPQTLRTAIRVMLNTGHPMYIWWGPDLLCFYNDAYRPSIGPEMHPCSLGRPAKEVWAEIWPIIGPQVDQVMSGGGATWQENALVPITRNGRRENVYWTYSYGPIDDETAASGVGGVLVVCTETTNQVLALRQSAEERERFAALFEQAPTFMAMLRGPEHRFELTNPGYQRLVGGRDVVGRTVAEALPEAIEQGYLKLLDEAYRSGQPYQGTGVKFTFEAIPGGSLIERYLDFVYQPIKDRLGQVVGIFVEGADVTARALAEAALREANETLEAKVEERTRELMIAEQALRQSQKMEAVGQLTGGLAHDFNNLLAGISGNIEMIGIRLAQGRTGEVERYMNAALGGTRRAAALTHRLLAFSRRQTLDPKPTNVNRMVAGLEELIRRTIGPAVALEVTGAADLWPALVDPSQLENAVLNLCINARDAMPEGGRITIETANRRLDAENARANDLPEGDYLSLSVTDTGIGMAPEIKEKVFEPFFTTKDIGEGTGLGLSMIYGFAKQSGGHVGISSTVGEGTTVRIFLPRHLGEGEVDDEAVARGALSRSERGATVLVVDDEPSVRTLLTDVLEDLGHTVIEAADSLAGLRILRSAARIDLLVSDVGLPGGMNGRQMAEAARQSRPGLRVLLITGYAEDKALGSDALDRGMAVMTKPFAIDALAARVRDLLSQP